MDTPSSNPTAGGCGGSGGAPSQEKPILGKETLDKMASVASACRVAMPEINQELHMHTR